MKAEKPAKTVDEYISRFPPDVQKALQSLRKIIRGAGPKADERIGYRMPGYKYHGWLVFFAGFKGHCSLFVASLSAMKTLKKDLEPYKPSGASIHFTPAHPLPASLVKKIVKTRMAENELRAKSKRSA